MINKNASKLPEFTQDSLSPVHDSSSTNNWILHLPLPKNEKLRERKVEERVIRSSWTGRPPAGRRTTGAARHRGWRRAEGVAAGAARVARNNTGKWTGGGCTTPAASSATSAARDSVPRMYAGGYLALFSSPRLLGARFTGERWAAAVSGTCMEPRSGMLVVCSMYICVSVRGPCCHCVNVCAHDRCNAAQSRRCRWRRKGIHNYTELRSTSGLLGGGSRNVFAGWGERFEGSYSKRFRR